MKRRGFFSALFGASAVGVACVSTDPLMSSEMLDALRFRCGDQWLPEMRKLRESQGRPCLTVNKVPGFLKHVIRKMRVPKSQEAQATMDVVRKIKERQRLYNYVYSSMVDDRGPAQFKPDYARILRQLDAEMQSVLGIEIRYRARPTA